MIPCVTRGPGGRGINAHLESQTARIDRCVAKERENNVECEAQERQCESRDRQCSYGRYREECLHAGRFSLIRICVCV